MGGREAEQVAIAVVEQQGAFLIGLRPNGKPLAGFWEFPGGRVEVGESPEEAAVRECLEETGISVAVASEYPRQVQHYDHARVELRFFACRPIRDEMLPRMPFRWASRDELACLSFPEGNAKLLATLTAELG